MLFVHFVKEASTSRAIFRGISFFRSPLPSSRQQKIDRHKPVDRFCWSRCRHRRTHLLSFIFAFKSFFNLVKRDIFYAQRLFARVDNYSEMVIIQIDRLYEDVDECSALIDVVHRHFTDKIKEGVYLRFGQTELLVIFRKRIVGQIQKK